MTTDLWMSRDMRENLISDLTAHMQPILEHFDTDHANECINIMERHLAKKLAVILESQEKMMESFLFQQKMIGSLIPSNNKYQSAFVCESVKKYGKEIPTKLTIELAKSISDIYTTTEPTDARD